MEKTTWKGSVQLAPVPPVMVSCGTMEKPNVLTIAWTGVLNTQPPMTYISVRPERYSYKLIKDSGEFVINLPTSALVKAIDYVGVRSGANENKFEAAKLTAQAASQLDAPMISESPLSLECKVRQIIPLGTHDMFIADIVAVNAANEIIDKDGKLDLSKANLCTYVHGEYFSLGKKIGSFGFSVRKKKKR